MTRVLNRLIPAAIPAALVAALAAALLSGCGGETYEWSGALLGANVAAIPVFHRDVFDVVYSAATGKDCSVVRLDRDETYCRPPEPLPPAPPYCTGSLGKIDCWAVPLLAGPVPPGYPPLYAPPPGLAPPVADGPFTLTPAQNADRTRAWPPL